MIINPALYNYVLSGATASTDDILSGKTVFLNNDELISGTMPDNGSIIGYISNVSQSFPIASGYHDGTGFVSILNDEQSKIIPENIKSGVSILGVEGECVVGGGNSNEDAIIQRTVSVLFNSTAQFIGSRAFYSWNVFNSSALKSVTFTAASFIGTSAFASCYDLVSANFPSVKFIDGGAFSYCSSLKDIYFPVAERLSIGAFYRCSGLSSVEFPLVISASHSVFDYCSNLVSVSFPELVSIGPITGTESGFFVGCSKLQDVYLPKLINVTRSMFYSCSSLVSIDLPVVTRIGYEAFRGCRSLYKISVPNVKTVDNYAFCSCSSLEQISLPILSSIYNRAFSGCIALKSVYLLGTSIAGLENSSAFYNTPIISASYMDGEFGSLFVRDSLYDSWKTTSVWSYFSDRFVPLTDSEIESLVF